jgi:hypothetical protein
VVRHPIYTGVLTGLLGTAIALSQVRGFIAFVLFFLAFWIKLRMEELWMRSQFGEAYATYAHQSAALVPYLDARRVPFARRIIERSLQTLDAKDLLVLPGLLSGA